MEVENPCSWSGFSQDFYVQLQQNSILPPVQHSLPVPQHVPQLVGNWLVYSKHTAPPKKLLGHFEAA
jgi:hypothetical protein